MEIHKPKPWHGWREFAKEVGIIVLGVLIALVAEQAVQNLHWHEAVERGREALHREMAVDSDYLRDRVLIGPCVDRRIAAAAAMIDTAATGKPTPSAAKPYIGPGRLTLISEWNTERASQALTHFPREELSKLGVWYDQMDSMRAWIEQEEDAWAKLATLKTGAALGPMDVALLRQDIQRARYLEYLMVLNAQRQLDRSRELGVQAGPPRKDWIADNCAI